MTRLQVNALVSLPALLAIEAACHGGLGLQSQGLDGLAAIGARTEHPCIESGQRGLAGMQLLQIAPRIREIGGGLVIGHG